MSLKTSRNAAGIFRKWYADHHVPNIEGHRRGIPPWVAIFADRSSGELLADDQGSAKREYHRQGEEFLSVMADSLVGIRKRAWELYDSQGMDFEQIRQAIGYKYVKNVKPLLVVMIIWSMHVRDRTWCAKHR